MTLRADHYLRYHNTNDGEDFWYVGLGGLFDIIAAEIADQPVVRAMNPDTGEILQGGALYILLDHVLDALRNGQTWRIEPLNDDGAAPQRGPAK